MEDANELFGIYFDLLRSPFGPLWSEDIDRTQAGFRMAQSHHYMTCWTRVADNLAVWSLYSPGKDSIQVKTTYGRLRKAVVAHFENYPYARAYKLEPNDPTDLFFPPELGPVEYIDFRQAYLTVRRQCLDYYTEKDSFFDKQIKCGMSLEDMGKKWADRDNEARTRIFQEPRLSGPLLKDHRYQHEQEVRFVLKLKRRDGRTTEQYKGHPMAGLDDPSRHPKAEDCPPNIFVPFASSNFMDFQVDGRVENYKYEAISNVLAKFGVQISKSSAFSPIDL
jgi:hypothetical protein